MTQEPGNTEKLIQLLNGSFQAHMKLIFRRMETRSSGSVYENHTVREGILDSSEIYIITSCGSHALVEAFLSKGRSCFHMGI